MNDYKLYIIEKIKENEGITTQEIRKIFTSHFKTSDAKWSFETNLNSLINSGKIRGDVVKKSGVRIYRKFYIINSEKSFVCPRCHGKGKIGVKHDV